MGRWSVAPAALSHLEVRCVTAAVPYEVRHALPRELPRLTAIEHEAGRRFEAIPALAGLPELAVAPEDFAAALARGQLWVAAVGAEVVGFACAELVDDAVHLDELDVLPAWGRRGIGQALVAAVVAYEAARGLPEALRVVMRRPV
jgi:4-diphosphocytidyl-2-C-methyl-D-erythritol kinase